MSALSHILASEPEPSSASSTKLQHQSATSQSDAATSSAIMPERVDNDNVDEHEDDDNDDQNDNAATPKPAADAATSTTAASTSKRTGAPAPQLGTLYQNTKMKHLKKEDGIPLWRKDMQYDFLRHVLRDQTKCFTKYSEQTSNHTFAEVYIDAMAKSSKCSKILKDKLLTDPESAITMAMVCLLVNIGRMNTTLNFFPEMRAQLRTYHPIPALQAHQDSSTYKQLQDAPRLKSILKGATEDTRQPSTIEDIRNAAKPRTNAVNLIFVMHQYFPKVTELHFPEDQEFFDLVMGTNMGSETRAKAFLWLMWWYLESDFSYEDSQRNPFGPGEVSEQDRDTDPLPAKVPKIAILTEEEEEAENVDPPSELKFGEDKRRERIAILASEPSPAMIALKRARKEKGHSSTPGLSHGDDGGSETGWAEYSSKLNPLTGRLSGRNLETGSEMTRSPSPGRSYHDDAGLDQSLHLTTPSAHSGKKGPGRGNWRRKKGDLNATSRAFTDSSHQKPLLPNTSHLSFMHDGSFEGWGDTPLSERHGGSQFGIGSGKNDHVPTPSFQSTKRNRGMTQHQSAVVNHRKQQIDYSLDRRIRKAHERARDKREQESAVIRAWKRIRSMPPDYDSEEEAIRIRRARERSEKDTDEWRTTNHLTKDGEDFFDNVDLWRRPRMLFAGFVRINGEASDVGEESKSLANSLRRASRRLERWQDTPLPGDVVLRRMQIEAQGGFEKPRPRISLSPVENIAEIEEPESTLGNGPVRGSAVRGGRRRAGTSRAKGRRETNQNVQQEIKADPEPAPDEDDGAAELDEEDREILGEVDADESEDDDEDENMDD